MNKKTIKARKKAKELAKEKAKEFRLSRLKAKVESAERELEEAEELVAKTKAEFMKALEFHEVLAIMIELEERAAAKEEKEKLERKQEKYERKREEFADIEAGISQIAELKKQVPIEWTVENIQENIEQYSQEKWFQDAAESAIALTGKLRNAKACAKCFEIGAEYYCNACSSKNYKVSYCSKECQNSHWRIHKRECESRRKDRNRKQRAEDSEAEISGANETND